MPSLCATVYVIFRLDLIDQMCRHSKYIHRYQRVSFFPSVLIISIFLLSIFPKPTLSQESPNNDPIICAQSLQGLPIHFRSNMEYQCFDIAINFCASAFSENDLDCTQSLEERILNFVTNPLANTPSGSALSSYETRQIESLLESVSCLQNDITANCNNLDHASDVEFLSFLAIQTFFVLRLGFEETQE